MFEKLKYLIFLFAGIFASSVIYSQSTGNFEVKTGLSIQFGTHMQRLGFMYQMYYFKNNIQLSQGTMLTYHIKNIGNHTRTGLKKGLELNLNISTQYYWGSTSDKKKYMFDEYILLAPYPYGIGYHMALFLDQRKTTQTVGSLFSNIENLGFVFENDFLGIWKGFEDKFRTGAFALSYSFDSIRFSVQSTHWTGKSIDAPKVKDPDYLSRYGYRDLTDVAYGKFSHGILALRCDYFYNHSLTYQAEMGIDAEQIRHALQNRLFHDLIISFLNPKAGNPHYPMLQEDGSPYLFKENQNIKPLKSYAQLGINNRMFY